MRNLKKRRIRLAWLLMLVYLPMMLAVTFHHHTEEEGDAISYCYDCAHHIHHDGHITAGSSFTHDCLLCQLHNLPYVVPTIIKIAAFIAIVHIAFVVSCSFVKTREGNIYTTRGPPVLLSL